MIFYFVLAGVFGAYYFKHRKDTPKEPGAQLPLMAALFFILAGLFVFVETLVGHTLPWLEGVLLVLALLLVGLTLRQEIQKAVRQRETFFDRARDEERKKLLALPRNSILAYKKEQEAAQAAGKGIEAERPTLDKEKRRES
ncbi:hypothetical protein ABB02_01433 [Clostridiaceae bacterium JG1575]|nr:hypothetical protein ABB02_01433 [Clostridiaceae bacterium JG1575]